jgi:hypothetical protein
MSERYPEPQARSPPPPSAAAEVDRPILSRTDRSFLILFAFGGCCKFEHTRVVNPFLLPACLLLPAFYYLHPIATMSASDQIRQMVNFILQEAHEKANEIRVKVGGA